MPKTLIEVLDMKIRPLNRKADLSLSINAIVILILAITMLGLGLAFIRNQFGGATNKLQDVLNQIDANQKADLEKSADRITLTTDNYEIKRGGTKNIYFAIRNNLGTDKFTFVLEDNIACDDFVEITGQSPDVEDITFETFNDREIEGGRSSVLPLAINVASKAAVTVYSCSITIPYPSGYQGGTGNYEKKDFIVTVTP